MKKIIILCCFSASLYSQTKNKANYREHDSLYILSLIYEENIKQFSILYQNVCKQVEECHKENSELMDENLSLRRRLSNTLKIIQEKDKLFDKLAETAKIIASKNTNKH